jgi:hypothetical protein
MGKLAPNHPRFFSAKAGKVHSATPETIPDIGGVKKSAARSILFDFLKNARLDKSLSLQDTSARANAVMSMPQDAAKRYQGITGIKTLLKRIK